MAPKLDKSSAESVNPNAISIVNIAKLLSMAGGNVVTEEMIRAALLAGAPQNADGTLNMIHFAAWLIRERLLAD